MSYNPQNPNGQATMANSTPVVVASDQSTVPVSAAGLPLPTGAATGANQTSGSQKTQIVDGSGNVIGSTSNALNVNITSGGASNVQYAEGATAATATGMLAMGKNGTTLKAAQTDGSGNLRVDLSQTSANATALKVDGSAVTQPVSGTITANVGTTNGLALDTTVSGLQVAQGSATSGQKGELAQGAVTTAAPTYTTAQTSPLSLDTSGNLRTSVNNTVTVSGTITATPSGTQNVNVSQVGGNSIATGNGTTTTGTQRVTLASDSTGQVALAAGSSNIGGVELIDSGGTNKLNINASGQAAVAPTAGDLTSGNQTTKITDGTNTVNVGLGDSGNGFALGGAGRLTQSFTITTSALTTAAIDAGNYRWVSVQFTAAGTGGSTSFQCSNDNTNWVNTALISSQFTGNPVVTSTSSAGLYHGPLTGRYFRLSSAISSGSTTGTIIFSTGPSALNSIGVAASQSGTWTVQPGNTPNTSPWLTSLQPATAGGWSISSQTALTNTVVSAKASAGQVGGHMFYNPNSSVAYIQVFNVASGSVSLGSTAPTMVLSIPAASAANVEWANGIAFGTAISLAATTTATGSTAPSSSLVGFLLYK